MKFKVAITVSLLACLLFVEKSATAQVVQLPSFRVFSVNTAVKVPDGGYMRLGGVNRHAAGATSRGVPGLSNIPMANRLFKNRAIGADTSASNVGVTTNIIILEEYEEKVMAEARRREALRADEAKIEQRADFISKNVGRSKR